MFLQETRAVVLLRKLDISGSWTKKHETRVRPLRGGRSLCFFPRRGKGPRRWMTRDTKPPDGRSSAPPSFAVTPCAPTAGPGAGPSPPRRLTISCQWPVAAGSGTSRTWPRPACPATARRPTSRSRSSWPADAAPMASVPSGTKIKPASPPTTVVAPV